MSENIPVRKVKCPYCRKDSVYSVENPFRPFCSERCRLMDLGAWAEGSYKIPTNTHVDINTDEENPSEEEE